MYGVGEEDDFVLNKALMINFPIKVKVPTLQWSMKISRFFFQNLQS